MLARAIEAMRDFRVQGLQAVYSHRGQGYEPLPVYEKQAHPPVDLQRKRTARRRNMLCIMVLAAVVLNTTAAVL